MLEPSQRLISEHLEIYEQLMKENHPDINVGIGPFRDMVLYPAAYLSAINQENVDSLKTCLFMGDVFNDPDGVEPELLDKYASNWLVARHTGNKAAGLVKIRFKRTVITTIPQGTVFNAHLNAPGDDYSPFEPYLGNLVHFKTQKPYTARSRHGATVLSSDKPFEEDSVSSYIVVPVIATSSGNEGNIPAGTELEIQLNSRNITSVVAENTFYGGTGEETNKQLIVRLREKIRKKMSDR